MRATARGRLELAALLAGGAALWATSFVGRFQYDDFAQLRGAGTIGAALPSLRESVSSIRPLTRILFRLEQELFGAEPHGFHFLSVGLHLASVLLVWCIVRRLRADESRGSTWLPLASALLVLVHPVATEAVTYLSGRASLLSAVLSLLAVERWLAWREREPNEPRFAAWSSLLAFALALLAKETAAVLPLALVLVDRARSGRSRGGLLSRGWRAYLPHLLVLALFLAGASAKRSYREHLSHSLALRGPLANTLLLPRVAIEGALLYAAPWRLNLDHDLDATLGARALLEWFAVALAATAAVVALRRGHASGAGVLWYLIHLLPTASIVARNDLLSERNLYLPAVGLAVATAWFALETGARLSRRRTIFRALATGAAVLLVASLAALTVERNRLYGDSVALWSDAVSKSPGKGRPHANLGWSLYLTGDLDAAISEYRIALRLEPGDSVTERNLRRAWEQKRRRDDATAGPHVSAPDRTPAD